MKLLLDENLPHRLRALLPGHDVNTVAHMKWQGVENGALLQLAASHGFDALVTKDLGVQYQQNVAALPCAIVVLEAKSNSLKDIQPLVPALLVALASLKPNCVMTVR
jgi:predicted nuclease of predicted toxin-antitoxin system